MHKYSLYNYPKFSLIIHCSFINNYKWALSEITKVATDFNICGRMYIYDET